jgi:uncharacterized membrane protein YoaK (UPF0700 family)
MLAMKTSNRYGAMLDGDRPHPHDETLDCEEQSMTTGASDQPVGSAPSVDRPRRLLLLPTVLAVVAGSADVISFLGLGGLFVAQITGNLVILAAHLVTGTTVGVAQLLSVPAFILVLALARLLATGLEAAGRATLRPLLLLQLLLLAGFLALGVAAGPDPDPNATAAIGAGMVGVAAMAVQNALVQLSLPGAPTTAVMTTNVTRFAMDLGEVLLRRGQAAKARRRAARTGAAIVGFTAGAALGAACFAAAGLGSLALPVGLAVLVLVLSLGPAPEQGQPTGTPT